MKRTITYQIPQEYEGHSVGEFLKEKGCSHKILVRLKEDPQGILVDGVPAYTIRRLRTGETLSITLTETASANIVPVKLPLSIVYEDEDILVVNKDAGVPVHPSQGHFDHTLANAVAWYCKEKGEDITYRAINRLDRDTTGLLVIAKHCLSACVLSDQMVKREIRREYRAVVNGKTPENGTINRPIGRVDGSTIERQIDEENGEPACTHYERISYEPIKDLSYIRLRLETGRTHQIRVHMASVGHPLPGDFLYNPDFRFISRQPLHSYGLSFTHPITGEPLSFFAELPEDMRLLL